MASTETDGKMIRRRNWTKKECEFLKLEVNKNKSVLFGEVTLALTPKMIDDAWIALTERFNDSSSTRRNIDDIKKKWKQLSSDISSTPTGGGPPSKPLSDIQKTVQLAIGESDEGVSGERDSSLLQISGQDNVCNTQITQDSEQSSKSRTLPLSPEPSTSGSHLLSSSQPSLLPQTYSPQPSTSAVPTNIQRIVHQSPLNVMPTEPINNQKLIEELTIRKLQLQIEYYDMKVKSMKQKLEE